MLRLLLEQPKDRNSYPRDRKSRSSIYGFNFREESALVAVAPPAPTAAPAATISAVASTTAATAAAALGLGPRFVDVDRASAN